MSKGTHQIRIETLVRDVGDKRLHRIHRKGLALRGDKRLNVEGAMRSGGRHVQAPTG